MQPIRIQATPPRDIAAYRDIVKRGLGPYFFFGWFSITGPAIPTAMMLAHAIIGDAPKEIFVPGVIAFVVAGAILGTILLRSGSNIKRERELALSRGVMIPATVLAHGRAFTFYKSVRDYTLTVEYAGPDGAPHRSIIRSSNRELHRHDPGDTIMGLRDETSGAVFFPVEAGCELHA